jgi:hypothetical protein
VRAANRRVLERVERPSRPLRARARAEGWVGGLGGLIDRHRWHSIFIKL